jgi:hypothetical protein
MLTRTVVWSFLAVSMMGLSACKDPVMMEEPFTESQVLGGECASLSGLPWLHRRWAGTVFTWLAAGATGLARSQV